MENFEEYLMEKFPDLFYEKDGRSYCPCGVSCPDGWKEIVDNLCAAMVNYSKGYRFVKNPDKLIRLKVWIGNKIQRKLIWVADRVFKLDYGTKGFLTQDQVKVQKEASPKRVEWQKKIYSWRRFFDVKDAYLKEMNLCPKISQIKQKYDLRVYVDNASPEVYGMIGLAEQIASVTCEETGQKGFPCIRGGWMRTLSEEKMIGFGYNRL